MDTTTITDHLIVHLEWWDGRTGQEVLMAAMKAARPYVLDDGVHLYHPDALTWVGDEEHGEAEIFFTVCLVQDRLVTDCSRFLKTRIVEGVPAGCYTRVKMIGPIPSSIARGTLDEFWDWDAE